MTDHRALGSGDRLERDPSDAMAALAFGGELEAADLLHPALGYADVAHVAALAAAGVVPGEEARTLVAGLRRLADRDAGTIDWDPKVGDVYNNRERLLRADVGDTAGWLATGRARREATTLAWLLVTREAHLAATSAAIDLLEALVAVASAHRATLVTDYTYLQHAQPTTFGHYLLSFAYPVLRDAGRLVASLDEVDASPAGSGSVNGTRFPLDRELLARLLGFPRVRRHTRDAMWPSDVAQRPGQAVVVAATGADRLVAELLLFCTSEFGFVELADEHCRTSVIMPQKKNPYALTQVRRVLRELVATAAAVTLTQLTPSGQPDNRTTAYEVVPRMLERLGDAHGLLAEVLTGMSVDVAAMAHSAEGDFSSSTDLCDLMTQELRISNRLAHRIVGRAVRTAIEQRRDRLTRDDLVAAARSLGSPVDVAGLDPAAVERLDDPHHVVSLRTTPGGAGPGPMGSMLDELTDAADRLRDEVARRRGALAGFDEAIDEILERA